MNILHASADPPPLQHLKEMLGSSARADDRRWLTDGRVEEEVRDRLSKAGST